MKSAALGPSPHIHDQATLAQFEECRTLAPSRLFSRIEALNKTGRRISEEALVMLARDHASKGNDALSWKLIQILCDRVSLSLGRTVRLWRLAPPVAEEVIDAVLSNLYSSVLDTSGKARFWEIRFWVCFDRFLLTTVRSHRNRVDKIASPDYQTMSPSDDNERHEQPDHDWSDPALRAVISEALGLLPDNLRTAFMLKHWAGFSESSKDPDDRTTIASIMQVSDRTVRNYLARAETILNEWRQGTPTQKWKRSGK